MNHSMTVDSQRTLAGPDGRTSFRCPDKGGNLIGAGRCVEMQPTCSRCPFAAKARAAVREARDAGPVRERGELKPVKYTACVVCAGPLPEERTANRKTCGDACLRKRRAQKKYEFQRRWLESPKGQAWRAGQRKT